MTIDYKRNLFRVVACASVLLATCADIGAEKHCRELSTDVSCLSTYARVHESALHDLLTFAARNGSRAFAFDPLVRRQVAATTITQADHLLEHALLPAKSETCFGKRMPTSVTVETQSGGLGGYNFDADGRTIRLYPEGGDVRLFSKSFQRGVEHCGEAAVFRAKGNRFVRLSILLQGEEAAELQFVFPIE